MSRLAHTFRRLARSLGYLAATVALLLPVGWAMSASGSARTRSDQKRPGHLQISHPKRKKLPPCTRERRDRDDQRGVVEYLTRCDVTRIERIVDVHVQQLVENTTVTTTVTEYTGSTVSKTGTTVTGTSVTTTVTNTGPATTVTTTSTSTSTSTALTVTTTTVTGGGLLF